MLDHKNRIATLFRFCCLVGMSTSVGCGTRVGDTAVPDGGRKPASETKTVSTEKPTTQPKVYDFKGVVRSVEQEEGNVTIRHEEIPGLMPAMTMPFTVKDKALLDGVEPGDEVEGKLTIGKGSSLLTELTVTRVAESPPMTLRLKGGVAKLVESKPRLIDVGDPIPDFEVLTQDGNKLRLSDLKGQVVVLTFIYTRCPLPDFCPLLDKKFRELASIEERSASRRESVRLLSISFDPENDTPEVLSKHAQIQGAKPPLWTFAVATHEELGKVAAPLGLMYGPTANEIIHNRLVVIIAPDGTLAQRITGKEGGSWTPVDVSKVVHGLIPGSSKE